MTAVSPVFTATRPSSRYWPKLGYQHRLQEILNRDEIESAFRKVNPSSSRLTRTRRAIAPSGLMEKSSQHQDY
jgi:hypothetical protein